MSQEAEEEFANGYYKNNNLIIEKKNRSQMHVNRIIVLVSSFFLQTSSNLKNPPSCALTNWFILFLFLFLQI